MVERSPFDSLIGATLGNYCLEELIEQDETSSVYRARNTLAGALFRLRVIVVPPYLKPEDRIVYLGRFQQEANQFAALHHRHILPGKSGQFKAFCLQALEAPSSLPSKVPTLEPSEQADFQRAHETLKTRASLEQSLLRQNRARLTIRSWRSVHIVLACLALLIILFHGVMELLTNVLHIIKPFYNAGYSCKET
jgi:hypothetical protein